MNFKEIIHKNSLNFYNNAFKFFDLGFSKELFYKIIVKTPEEPQQTHKKSEEREHSPIKAENFELHEPKDFKENLLSKSLCVKMNEERNFSQNEHILALSQKMNVNVINSQIYPIHGNRKQEKLNEPREKFMDVPSSLIKSKNLLISTKKTNKIFDPLYPPELPNALKDTNLIKD